MNKTAKVHMCFNFNNHATGGGSRFLYLLQQVFQSQLVFSKDPKLANVVLFNSHHDPWQVLHLKKRFPEKIFVQRIDGPMCEYNQNDRRDETVKLLNDLVADASIFQSKWSYQTNFKMGIGSNMPFAIIHNGVNTKIFYPHSHNHLNRPIKLIATSWSKNANKGFATLQWLDKNLNLDDFSLTLVGNSPVPFKNIRCLPILLDPNALADELRRHNIYIFASKVEACSNALLEALACGLPVVAYDGASNKEVAGDCGEYFSAPENIPFLLDKIIARYEDYKHYIKPRDIESVAAEYLNFFQDLCHKQSSGFLQPKRIVTKEYFKRTIQIGMKNIKTLLLPY